MARKGAICTFERINPDESHKIRMLNDEPGELPYEDTHLYKHQLPTSTTLL